MQLNTTAALMTAIFSAVIGFGLAFYIERKLSSTMQRKSQKILTSIAMISFGYGLMATLNEVIGFPLQGLHIRYDKLIGFVILNMAILPIVFLSLAKVFGLKDKTVNVYGDNTNNKSSTFKSENKQDELVLSVTTKPPVKQGNNTLAVLFHEKKSENNLTEVKMIDEEKVWEQAFNEFDSEARRKGLWAKLLVEFNGDNEKAKVKYFKERFEQIKLELLNEIEQAKQKEIQAKESERLAIIEMTKKLTAEECIGKGLFELKEHKSKTYYIFPSGEASIKRKDEYIIYANETLLVNAIDNYLVTELLPRDGFLRSFKEKLTEVEIKNKKFVDALERNSYKFKGYDTEGEGENKWCFLYHGRKIYFDEDELIKLGKNFL